MRHRFAIEFILLDNLFSALLYLGVPDPLEVLVITETNCESLRYSGGGLFQTAWPDKLTKITTSESLTEGMH